MPGRVTTMSSHFNVKVALILHTPKTREVAIGQLIMHGREHLVGIKPLGRRSIPIAETLDAFLLGAMDAAEDGAVVLDPMPDDAAAAMRAGGRERLDRAFEAVEDHGAAAHGDLEALVVVVAALFTSRHGLLLQLVFNPR